MSEAARSVDGVTDVAVQFQVMSDEERASAATVVGGQVQVHDRTTDRTRRTLHDGIPRHGRCRLVR